MVCAWGLLMEQVESCEAAPKGSSVPTSLQDGTFFGGVLSPAALARLFKLLSFLSCLWHGDR